MKIYLENQQNQLNLDFVFIKNIVRKIVNKERKGQRSEVNIIFTDNLKITQLNKKYLHRNYPTDVLAFGIQEGFPLKGNSCLLGDIVISVQAALAKAKELKLRPIEEIHLYVIHGLLHLLGYDDNTARKRKIMRRKEEEYLTYASAKKRNNR